MPGCNGLEAISRIAEIDPDLGRDAQSCAPAIRLEAYSKRPRSRGASSSFRKRILRRSSSKRFVRGSLLRVKTRGWRANLFLSDEARLYSFEPFLCVPKLVSNRA